MTVIKEKNVYAYYVINKQNGKVVAGPFSSREKARYERFPGEEQIVRFSPEKVVR